MDNNLDQLKKRESQAWSEFARACEAVLKKAEAIKALHSPIYAAGGQPTEYPQFVDAIQGCKQFVDHQAHQAAMVAHIVEKQQVKAARSTRRTYGLKKP